MTEFELGWITAAVEGEGSFFITPNRFVSRGEWHINYLPQINITNSDKLFLERCQKIVSEITGKVRPIQGDRAYTAPNHKRIYKVVLGNYSDIIAFCDVVIPHLCGKQRQAVLVRELAGLCIGSRGKGIPCDQRKRFYEEVRELNSGHLRLTQEANTPDMILEERVMKIESELQGNLQRVSGDAAPPIGQIQ